MRETEEFSNINLAFSRAVRQGVFEALGPVIQEQWGRLRLTEQDKALLPWKQAEVPAEELPAKIKYFHDIVVSSYLSGEVRY